MYAGRSESALVDRPDLNRGGRCTQNALAGGGPGGRGTLGESGIQTFSTRVGPLEPLGQYWRAVWEAGEDVALVDGASALLASGLKGWSEESVHISAVHHHKVARISGVAVHKVIRRVEGRHCGPGLPRTTQAVAAIRAADWAVSDRQAATIMAMTVQQRLATGAQLLNSQRALRGRTRRAFIKRIALDIADGVQALGELQFAEACPVVGSPRPQGRRCGPWTEVGPTSTSTSRSMGWSSRSTRRSPLGSPGGRGQPAGQRPHHRRGSRDADQRRRAAPRGGFLHGPGARCPSLRMGAYQPEQHRRQGSQRSSRAAAVQEGESLSPSTRPSRGAAPARRSGRNRPGRGAHHRVRRRCRTPTGRGRPGG